MDSRHRLGRGSFQWAQGVVDYVRVSGWFDSWFERRSRKAQATADQLRGWQYYDLNWPKVLKDHGPAVEASHDEFMSLDEATAVLRKGSLLDLVAFSSPVRMVFRGELTVAQRPDGRYGLLGSEIDTEAARRRSTSAWTKIGRTLMRVPGLLIDAIIYG